ncbi:MAG: SET domain-containing protein [Chitinophagia bacterium]|nr:SET domain-containing protein [Chitinophagia bacterium]
MKILPSLYISQTPHMGRGVFTDHPITAGSIVEISPVVVMDAGARALLDRTPLHDYIFEWGEDRTLCCMALGYVPVYNHACPSNCEYEMDYTEMTITVTAMRGILAGEELTINYNGDFDDGRPVWFQDFSHKS